MTIKLNTIRKHELNHTQSSLIDLRERGRELDWIQLAQNSVNLWNFVITAMNLCVTYEQGIFQLNTCNYKRFKEHPTRRTHFLFRTFCKIYGSKKPIPAILIRIISCQIII